MDPSCICEQPIANENLKIEPLHGVTHPGQSMQSKRFKVWGITALGITTYIQHDIHGPDVT